MYLYGASGHAKVIVEILEENGIKVHGLFDDNSDIKSLLNYSVLGSSDLKKNDRRGSDCFNRY